MIKLYTSKKIVGQILLDFGFISENDIDFQPIIFNNNSFRCYKVVFEKYKMLFLFKNINYQLNDKKKFSITIDIDSINYITNNYNLIDFKIDKSYPTINLYKDNQNIRTMYKFKQSE